ncbi:MAG: DNA alkylation repair protein [Christensenellaceae bacterium]|nr:DNA alkylation repair protein [Christensenellaceae bacterium]
MDRIREFFMQNKEKKYAAFQAKLMPTVDRDRVLGVRVPLLRKFAKTLPEEEKKDFLSLLPHEFFDENMLHAIMLCMEKEPLPCINAIERFLPYIDNWAVCDTLRPKIFKKEPILLEKSVWKWLSGEETYTVRFGIGCALSYFMGEAFLPEFPEKIAALKPGEYYIDMMRAWYFAELFAQRKDEALPYLAERKLDKWTHNKTITKACESFRIADELKAELRGMRGK